MNFEFDEMQNELKRSARKFLAAECTPQLVRDMAKDERGCPPDLWDKIVSLGWTALPFPAQYGGVGCGIMELAVLMEEMGRANLPGPFFSSIILGGLSISYAGSERHKQKLLPGIAAGEKIATLAVLESGLRYEPSSVHTLASRTASGYTINGTKLFVPDAHLADYVICAARLTGPSHKQDDIGLLVIRRTGSGPGVTATRLQTMAGDKQFELVFDGTTVAAEDLLCDGDGGWLAVCRVLEVAAVSKCAEMIGAGQRILELCLEQGLNRHQFGRPVGSFQAIQHHCADIVMNLDLGRLLTYQAAWMLSEGHPCSKQVSIAKAFVSDAYLRVVTLGHQVLGGNGLMDEMEMPLYSKRAPAAMQYFGSPDYHRELVARAMGL